MDDDTFLDDLIRTAKWPLIGLAVLFAICFTAGYFAGRVVFGDTNE